MKKLLTLIGLLIIQTSSLFSQKTGIVIDELTNKPIPYVNIHISGTQIGFTTNQNGEFSIDTNQADTAVFSAVGYYIKRFPIELIPDKIYLSQKVYEIPEVTILQRDKVYFRVGELKRQFPGCRFGNGFGYSKMIGQFIPYEQKYEQTPFVKSIVFFTYSYVRNAKFNVRLFQLNSNGKPGDVIYDKNIIAIARKGARKTKIDLDSLNIRFPTSGLIVAIEWLNIEENKFEYTYTMQGSKKKLKATSVEPSFSVYKNIENETRWSYWGDDWYKDRKQSKSIQMELTLKN